MPKRIPMLEPGDDEPKYFTMVQLYPLNTNWELLHDYITFGCWIAGCIGPQPFFVLFYKPIIGVGVDMNFDAQARGQVLLEINREYAHPERLLGEHRWSDFLCNPSQEEAGHVTQIFYSIYNAGRSVQKDGKMRMLRSAPHPNPEKKRKFNLINGDTTTYFYPVCTKFGSWKLQTSKPPGGHHGVSCAVKKVMRISETSGIVGTALRAPERPAARRIGLRPCTLSTHSKA
ncbi:hypothetical protein B0H16DRAFT_1474104 [Mycena metata]|uniref:Uncharacterized protein n=1 Tax=Mycena metata TaxID=1033252 RepID=A0AAD7MK88_9AGAR|nr:hypothetical protein B0H16DRAFT_1474104 [Mycena metata]